MKEDKLEKFVTDHRNAFDDLEPSGSVWEKLSTNEPVKKNYRLIKIISQVAAAILLFVGAYYFHDIMQSNKNQYALSAKQNKEIKIIDINQNKVLLVHNTLQSIETKTEKNTNHQKINNTNKKVRSTYDNKELAEVKAYYSEIIKNKKAEVLYCTENNPDVKTEINNEFGQLDKAFKELQNDLRENVDNRQVVDAMIQNYRMKLEVLEYMKNHVCTADLK